MKKQLLVGLATGLFLYGMTNTAMALSFDGTTTGTFNNPTGAPGMIVSGVASQNPFTWGDGTYFDSPPSSLLFTGTTFSVDDAIVGSQPFVLGTLDYYNGIIALNTVAYSVDLDIGLMFTNPGGIGEEHFSFNLDLINTPNIGSDEYNADYVSLPSMYSETIFSEGGTDYTLTLAFGNFTGGFGSSDEFHVYEGERASAQLMGTITSDVAPVPEPATMLLFGTGLAGLAGYRRRQQAKKK